MIYTIGFKFEGYKESTLKDSLIYLEQLEYIGLDIETTRKFKGKYGKAEGLDPYLTEVVMIQIGDANRQYIIDARKFAPRVITAFFYKLDAIKPKFVGHNLKFEFKHILHNYSYKLHTCIDTMLMETMIMNGFKHDLSLKSLIVKYLGSYVDKEIRMSFLTLGNKDFNKYQIEYGADDIILPMQFFMNQMNELKSKGMTNLMKLEFRFLKVLALMEYNGFQIDKEQWLALADKNKERLVEQNNKLVSLLLSIIPSDSKFINHQLDMFSTDTSLKIKFSSSKEVVELFSSLGINCETIDKKTKLVKATVESKAIKSYLVVNQELLPENVVTFVREYLKYKEIEQSCTTFGKKFIDKYVNPITGRLHSNFKQIVETGRMSSSNPK